MEETGIARQLTVARVLRELRKDIFLGKYKQGQPITETEISQQYGISRSSVRSAFQELERDGLLKVGGTGRKSICKDLKVYLMDLCNTRGLLECEAARLILRNEKADFSELMKLVGGFHAGMSQQDDQQLKITRLNDLFHAELFRLADSSTLQQCFRVLAPTVSVIGELNAHYNLLHDAHDYYSSHRKIADLLMAGSEEVYDVLHAHTSESMFREVLRMIEEERKA